MTKRRTSTRLARASVLGSAASALLLGACSSGSGGGAPPGDQDLDPAVTVGRAQLGLTRAADCDDLLGKIQGGVILELEQLAEQLRTEATSYDNRGLLGDPGIAVDVEEGAVSQGDTGRPQAPPSATGDDGNQPDPGPATGMDVDDSTSGGEADAAGEPSANPAPNGGEFSGTTVQVQDVDEADIVKTDGDLLYLLHGGTLFVLEAWPADSTQILASTLVEGEPTEMFVRDGRAVVFSNVWGELRASGDTAEDTSYYYGSPGYTKLTVLDVSGEEPSVVRESYVEGHYVSSRRHDGVVRAVMQDGFKVPRLGYPDIQYRDPFGNPFPQADIDAQIDAWLSRTRRAIENSEIGDWLPREFARNGSTMEAVAPRCGDYYAPDPGLTEQGVTSVVSLDLDDPTAAFSGATILGNAERVYANSDALVLTQTDYRGHFTGEPVQRTVIHRFDISGTNTAYTASGAVAGYVHNQFSLDERNGVIRVSTTEEFFGGGMGRDDVQGTQAMPGSNTPTPVDSTQPAEGSGAEPPVDPTDPSEDPVTDGAEGTDSTDEVNPTDGADTGGTEDDQTAAGLIIPKQVPEGPVNRIVTLVTDGTSLVEHGSTDDFGLNERIYATRFMGDRAYVVTFRRTDPLFVVDLSDDANPRVMGELHIPGFSNYLYPLGNDHLFAIGEDADENGRVTGGLTLQVFDVSDPENPGLAFRHLYDDPGFSPANIDHRAISFHPDRDLVAFPFTNYSTGESSLEVFRITETDIVRVGGMGGAQEEITLEECLVSYGWDDASIARELELAEQEPEFATELLYGCRQQETFRRGLFRDGVVYGISTGGVYAYDLEAMSAGPLGQASLPTQVWDNRDYGDGKEDVPAIGVPMPGVPSMGGGTGGADGSGMTSGSTPADSAGEPDDVPPDMPASQDPDATDGEAEPDPNG